MLRPGSPSFESFVSSTRHRTEDDTVSIQSSEATDQRQGIAHQFHSRELPLSTFGSHVDAPTREFTLQLILPDRQPEAAGLLVHGGKRQPMLFRQTTLNVHDVADVLLICLASDVEQPVIVGLVEQEV